MADRLIELGANPVARTLIKSLGLPIPIPQKLERTTAAWEERPLQGRSVAIAAAPGGALGTTLVDALAATGASTAQADAATVHALVFDATGIGDPAALQALYDFGHAWVGKLARSGRVVVLGRPPEREKSPARGAAQAALEGFVRSAGKEIGRNGSTALSVYVEEGAEAQLEGLLAFVLSPRAAFVSGARIRLTATAGMRRDRNGKPGSYTRSLAGKVVLLTGAARGIGAATAQLLAREGARVVGVDRPADSAPLGEVMRAIDGVPLAVDITDPAAPATIAEHVRKNHGALDAVIHNAGVTRDKTLARMTPELWNQAVDINLGAVLRITDALLPEMIRDGGRIICLSSVAGIAGNVGQTNYSASKAGIIGFVTSLAPSLASRGITVNAIAPGFIETRLTAAIPFAIREAGRRLSSLAQGGLPEDVGQALTFLAMPASQGLTGSVLRVCGGAFIGA